MHITRTPQPERGASSVEYGLLIAGIAMVLAIAVYALGTVTNSTYTETCDQLDAAASATASC